MKQLTILVDLDDVLNNLLEEWVKALNKKYDYEVCIDDITDWNIAKFYPTLTDEQLFSPFNSERFWWGLKPTDGSVGYLSKLIKDGHRIYIVTSTLHSNFGTKVEWLLYHFPYLFHTDVINTYNKQAIVGDVLIDDGVHNLVGGKYKKLLYDRPHNRQYYSNVEYSRAEFNSLERVHNWEEIYQAISKMALEKCPYCIGEDGWHRCLECKHSCEDNGALYCKLDGYGEFEV